MKTAANRKPNRNRTNRRSRTSAVLDSRQPVPPSARRLNFGSKWQYAPALDPEPALDADYGLFADGGFVTARSGRFLASNNPATDGLLARISVANESDVDVAVEAARKGYESLWSKLPPRERAKYLYRIARLIQEKSRELALVETVDGGLPIKDSRDFILPTVAATFFYYAGWADKLQYAFPGRSVRPVGVVGQICPSSLPLLAAALRMAPALACGNTVLVKPHERTSLSLLHFARILQEAELPPGVVNVVTGDGDTGTAITRHTDVDLVAFTGSAAIAKVIAKNVAGSGKNIALGAGGDSVSIVFEDAAIDQAVEGVITSAFINRSPVPISGSRLFVQESAYETVLRKLRNRLQTLRVGDPLDRNTDVGPLNSPERVAGIKRFIKKSLEQGAELHQASCSLPPRGYWFAPSFVTNATPSHAVEESLWPLLSVATFRTPEEAFERANNTPHGMSTAVWTEKGSKGFKMISKLRAGVVWVNTCGKFDPASPFGGFKSGPGDHLGGMHALTAYVRTGH